ncbi:uncharacterized protein J3D65DRAFT_600615 [Phyllosticta citribraziliensis]|uniref:Uncharacterized protein n=1 Tax=Phyllosticta citribraziliensis TaxID=989973 RepID=A0ABR1M0F1_9PEZI
MCKRYVPIYQCRHRDHVPQPELYLCQRALAAFTWQSQKAPSISLTNASFVLQKLAARTAGCLRESTSELALYYQVQPEWCDACLANGQATARAAVLEADELPFKRGDVGAWIPWKEGVEVARSERTEAQERVWVQDLRARPVQTYWRTVAAEKVCEDGEGMDEDEHEGESSHCKSEKSASMLPDRYAQTKELVSRCCDLISLSGSSPEKN